MSQRPAPRILLVEDEPLILDLIASTLEDGGFEVLQANNAKDAIAGLEASAGELAGLVTDVNLGPRDKGWDVARRARELRPNLPVVYMTGDSAHDSTSQGVPESVILSKPFAPAQVLVALVSFQQPRSQLSGVSPDGDRSRALQSVLGPAPIGPSIRRASFKLHEPERSDARGFA